MRNKLLPDAIGTAEGGDVPREGARRVPTRGTDETHTQTRRYTESHTDHSLLTTPPRGPNQGNHSLRGGARASLGEQRSHDGTFMISSRMGTNIFAESGLVKKSARLSTVLT